MEASLMSVLPSGGIMTSKDCREKSRAADMQQLSSLGHFLPCNLQTKSLDGCLASRYNRDITQDVGLLKVHALNLSGAASFHLSNWL